jgi:hypothetical protein
MGSIRHDKVVAYRTLGARSTQGRHHMMYYLFVIWFSRHNRHKHPAQESTGSLHKPLVQRVVVHVKNLLLGACKALELLTLLVLLRGLR